MRQGATLAEVLVASTLALLVLGVCVMVFVPALRVWNRGLSHSQVQESAMVTENWLRRDVEHASPDSIYWENSGLRLVVQGRPLEFDATGNMLWHESVLYWLADTGELHRQSTLLLPPPTAPPVLAAPSPDPTSRVVSRNLYAFECSLPAPGLVRFHVETVDGQYRYQVDGSAFTVLRPPPAAPSPSP